MLIHIFILRNSVLPLCGQGGLTFNKGVIIPLGLIQLSGKGFHLVVITLGSGEDTLLLRSQFLDFLGQPGDRRGQLQMPLDVKRTERLLFYSESLSFICLISDALAYSVILLLHRSIDARSEKSPSKLLEIGEHILYNYAIVVLFRLHGQKKRLEGYGL